MSKGAGGGRGGGGGQRIVYLLGARKVSILKTMCQDKKDEDKEHDGQLTTSQRGTYTYTHYVCGLFTT